MANQILSDTAMATHCCQMERGVTFECRAWPERGVFNARAVFFGGLRCWAALCSEGCEKSLRESRAHIGDVKVLGMRLLLRALQLRLQGEEQSSCGGTVSWSTARNIPRTASRGHGALMPSLDS